MCLKPGVPNEKNEKNAAEKWVAIPYLDALLGVLGALLVPKRGERGVQVLIIHDGGQRTQHLTRHVSTRGSHLPDVSRVATQIHHCIITRDLGNDSEHLYTNDVYINMLKAYSARAGGSARGSACACVLRLLQKRYDTIGIELMLLCVGPSPG